MKNILLTVFHFFLITEFSLAGNLELEDAQALETPYCVDMRIKQEHDRSNPLTTNIAMKELFDCRRMYRWPMSVKPDAAMVKRYGEKMKAFSNRPVLIWCTHGVRTNMLQEELSSVTHNIHSIKGGTLYLGEILSLRQ